MSGKVVPGSPENRDQIPSIPSNVTEAPNETPEIIYVGHQRALMRRFGCGAAVILWALFMLIPGLLLLLAVQGEIVIWNHSGVPEAELHPLIHVKLLMEAQTRGVSITTSTAQVGANNQTCVQTYVRFVLWQGRGDNVSYCDCYTRSDEQSVWQLANTGSGICHESGNAP